MPNLGHEEGRSLRSDLPSSTLLRLSALVTHDPVQGITTIDGVERKISVADPRRDIASLLEAMNGQRTLGQLRSRFTVGDSVLELILYLVNIRSIADVNKLWGPFHTMTENPQVFGYSMDHVEVVRHTRMYSWQCDPQGALPSTTLANIGALRTSCRSFDGEALSLDAVKGLLTLAYSNLVRSTPSAGGLYSCRLDIICVDEGSDVWGLHSWDPRNAEIGNQLKLIDSGELQHALESVSLLFGASALIVISVDPQIHSAKYSNRGYRYSLLEAGHVAQMINLAATEQGLGVLEWGAFNDRVLAECMDLTEHHPLVVVGLGNPIEVAKGPKEPDRQSLAEVNFSYYGVPDDHAGRSSGVAIAQIPFAFDGSLSPSGYASGIHWTRSLAGVKARSELMERQACQGFRVDVVGSAKALADRYYIYEVEEAFPSIMPAFLEESDEFAPFDSSNTEMQWRIAQSQQHGEVLVPVELVYFPVFSSQIGRRLCGSATSSGVAAHQTLE